MKQKLKQLCNNSTWKQVGNATIVTNISRHPLSQTEKYALSLGLRFDSGVDRHSYMEHVDRNYTWNDSEADKGFIQGILAACKALANKEPSTLPTRYIEALEGLAKNQNIVVTQDDKGSGIVIMDSSSYRQKLDAL